MSASRSAEEAAALKKLAEAVRAACLAAATAAYDDAGIQGLCAEGRWEAAVGAVRALDLRRVVEESASADP